MYEVFICKECKLLLFQYNPVCDIIKQHEDGDYYCVHTFEEHISTTSTIAPHGEKGAVWMHGQKGTTRL